MRVNKYLQKILCLVLAVVLIFSLSIPAFAADDAPQPRIDFVATMRIVSCSGGIYSSVGYFGHAFLVFTNSGNSQITIGHMPLAVGESITIGTYGNRDAHSGIWYNIEGYTGVMNTSYSLVTGVTLSELVSINAAINDHDYWTLSNNCASFARDVWNAGNSGITISGSTPSEIVSSICGNANYTKNPTIPSKSITSIARHTSSSYQIDPSGATSS